MARFQIFRTIPKWCVLINLQTDRHVLIIQAERTVNRIIFC